jgi:hypothetical protein
MKKLSAAQKLNKDKIVIPKFMENMDEYMRALDIIAKCNHVDEFDFDIATEAAGFAAEGEDVNLDLD